MENNNKIQSRHFHLRCGFLNVTYQDESKIEKIKSKNNKKEIKKNDNIKNKIKKIKSKNNKKETKKNDNIKNKIKKNIENEKLRSRKNDKKKIRTNQIQKILDVIGKIVLIGCALSGLLSSLKYSVMNKAIQ